MMLLGGKERQVFSGLVRNNKGELLKVWVEQGDTLLVTVAECIAVEVAIQVAIEKGYEQVIVEWKL